MCIEPPLSFFLALWVRAVLAVDEVPGLVVRWVGAGSSWLGWDGPFWYILFIAYCV